VGSLCVPGRGSSTLGFTLTLGVPPSCCAVSRQLGRSGWTRHPLATVGTLDTYYYIYDGTDENGIVGTVAP
jgi:hypothetical protein